MGRRFVLFVLATMVSFLSLAQNPGPDPDHADYYIKGRVSVEKNGVGSVEYKLYDVTSQGIGFDRYEYYRGREDGESVYFTLPHANPGNYPGGFDSGLTFWRFDEDIQQWQTDSEFRPSTIDFEETKQMAVMLLIDCSTSLREEWSVAKESAIAFIDQMYNTSHGRGNIKIGIIGFSTIGATQVFGIESLNENARNRMLNFIRYDLKQSDGTALFYAMDKAVEIMENYCNNNINPDDLSVASMAIFTDGLDQISRNLDKDILTTDDYREYVKHLKDKKIGKTSLYSVMFGLKGVDITTDAQLSKFRRIGEELTDKFVLLENIYQLRDEFSKFAKELTDAWQNLKCYAPNSYRGRVAWTFRNVEKPKPLVINKPEKPNEKGKVFFGINAGVGAVPYSYYVGYNHYTTTSVAFSGGLDLAFPVKEKSGIGFYGSVGYVVDFSGPIVNGGLLGLVGFNNGSALYLGGGYMGVLNANGADYRIGFKFKNGFYLFGQGSTIEVSMFHIGYFF